MMSPVIHTLVVGPFEVNCYIVDAGDALIVIDPGGDAAKICDRLQADGRPVGMYLLTHGHADHASALYEVAAAFPAPCGIHADDRAWAFTPINQLPPWYEAPREPASGIRALTDGETLDIGSWTVRCMTTPGHSPGGLSFYIPGLQAVFTGDTLFQETVGRTDVPGGDSRILRDSLRKLNALPSETAVYPGHGDLTTLAHERKHNPFLR